MADDLPAKPGLFSRPGQVVTLAENNGLHLSIHINQWGLTCWNENHASQKYVGTCLVSGCVFSHGQNIMSHSILEIDK